MFGPFYIGPLDMELFGVGVGFGVCFGVGFGVGVGVGFGVGACVGHVWLYCGQILQQSVMANDVPLHAMKLTLPPFLKISCGCGQVGGEFGCVLG